MCRMYATAAARSDGLLLLCGGRDADGTPMGDAYGLARHRDGRWEWAAAPGVTQLRLQLKRIWLVSFMSYRKSGRYRISSPVRRPETPRLHLIDHQPSFLNAHFLSAKK